MTKNAIFSHTELVSNSETRVRHFFRTMIGQSQISIVLTDRYEKVFVEV